MKTMTVLPTLVRNWANPSTVLVTRGRGMVGLVITELVGWARNLLGNSVTTELESSSLNDESEKFNILVKFVSNKTVVAVIRIQDKKKT